MPSDKYITIDNTLYHDPCWPEGVFNFNTKKCDCKLGFLNDDIGFCLPPPPNAFVKNEQLQCYVGYHLRQCDKCNKFKMYCKKNDSTDCNLKGILKKDGTCSCFNSSRLQYKGSKCERACLNTGEQTVDFHDCCSGKFDVLHLGGFQNRYYCK